MSSLGKSTPKVPQLITEIKKHPQTKKPDTECPLTLPKPVTSSPRAVFHTVLFYVALVLSTVATSATLS
jgi:hypothetical protein